MAFTPAALRFFRGLAKNNNKEWFEAHRAEYEREVREPMRDLIGEMDARFLKFAPEIGGDPKRSMFRINRDIRFSNDKSPYKTTAACWFYHMDAGRGVGGDAAHGGAGFYFDLGPDESWVGGGIWMPPRPTLARIRERIDEEHASLARLLRDRALRKRFGGLEESAMLTRMPRGYAESHPAATLLRHQSYTLGRNLTEKELYSPKLPDLLARDYARLLPIVRWFNAALGLRTLARR